MRTSQTSVEVTYPGLSWIKSAEARKVRKIFLFNEIDENSSREVIESLLELDTDKKKRPINLFLSSPGGLCSYGFAIVDTIEKLSCPIKAIALGEVCSMAPLIFIACDERIISKHTTLMLHPISMGVEDYLSFAQSRVKNAELIEEMYDKYFLERTNIPRRVYRKMKNKEAWLTASECIKYGIAHKIL